MNTARKSFLPGILLLLALFGLTGNSSGQVRLPRLISSGAVLQRDTEIRIWGWASPGEPIDLELKGAHYGTQAGNDGRWQLFLPPQEAGGPFNMKVRGTNEITLENILFGDVWICSGQSNMELTMERVKDTYPEIVSSYANPMIRQFLVPDRFDFKSEHRDLEGGSWKEADPQHILEFSAVAFFFAREIQERFGVPVGLINAALGGSPVEAWMSEEALKPFPAAYEELQRFRNDALIDSLEEASRARQGAWYGKLDAEDRGLKEGSEWYLDNTDTQGWSEMKIPGSWADGDTGMKNGSMWFRKTVRVPERMAGKQARLWLGRIVDQDFVYVNGTLVGTTGYQYPPRKYTVPDSLLKAGENTITVRVVSFAGKGGFIPDKPYFLAAGGDTIDLQGTWKYAPGASMEPMPPAVFIRWKPGGLYNRMIAPLLPCTIKGVIWYQGESNAGDPWAYYDTFPALIRDWRRHWKLGDFPFIYVQLANFMEETPEPAESDWAELRQAQLSTLSEPNTGMAVITDIGEWNDIHPLDKEDVGKRLAWQAMVLAYGVPGKSVPLCPIPGTAKFGKKKVEIEFRDTGGTLSTRDGLSPRYFELSADGKVYVKAEASVRGNTVVVQSDRIRHPVAVRYGWADNPSSANLVSKEGLPASPFRLEKE